MFDLRIRRQARHDLTSIRHYTLACFGHHKADQYLRGLADMFDRLALQPGLGRMESDLGAGVRSCAYRKHRVYYRVEGSQLVILSVFHHAQLIRSERLDD